MTAVVMTCLGNPDQVSAKVDAVEVHENVGDVEMTKGVKAEADRRKAA